MKREEKDILIQELSEKIKERNFCITDSSGLTVAQVNALRRMCYEAGIEYRVLKNTFIKKALEAQQHGDYTEIIDNALIGFSGVFFWPEAVSSGAKLIKQFRKEENLENFTLKAAYVDGDTYSGHESLETLSTLKSRQELLGDVISLLQSPIQRTISALKSSGATLGSLVKALGERGEEKQNN